MMLLKTKTKIMIYVIIRGTIKLWYTLLYSVNLVSNISSLDLSKVPYILNHKYKYNLENLKVY